jgi:two-component system response regulator
MAAPTQRDFHVLLVEDDAGDLAMVEDFFATHELPGALHHADDGVTALRFLRGEEEHAGAPRPDLILLDLNMPRMDGRQLLSIIKDDDSEWRTIPVVVFTTSSATEDITASYSQHANAFVTKALDFDGFQRSLREIHRFFGEVATTPAA